jgi:GNAT superfamily N-acetyltransferase
LKITSQLLWPDEAHAVDQGLEEANAMAAPLHEMQHLSCIANDDEGSLLGGALGRWWGQRCELQQLWVAPEKRGSGIGSLLVAEFERLARERGCESVYLETFSFQAPDFYRRRGYVSQFEHTGFPHGISKFLMQKHLLP